VNGKHRWPDVDVDTYGQITCPVPRCDAPVSLIRTYCIPLIAEQETDHEPEHATTSGWAVECTNGHRLMDHVDAIRELNATGGDLDGNMLDETGDYAPDYDHFVAHRVINALGGDHL
jgi:hypothetical protein